MRLHCYSIDNKICERLHSTTRWSIYNVTNNVNIKGRWKRYIEQLYAANKKPDTSPLEEEHEVPTDALGAPFIYSEIEKAMSTLKKRQVCRSG